MTSAPYRDARRVFWIVDNGSSHRGEKPSNRAAAYSSLSSFRPVHASWLNQIEIYFSIVQRKVVTPNDFASLADLQERLLAFQDHYSKPLRPFQWTFTGATCTNSSPALTIIRFGPPLHSLGYTSP